MPPRTSVFLFAQFVGELFSGLGGIPVLFVSDLWHKEEAPHVLFCTGTNCIVAEVAKERVRSRL